MLSLIKALKLRFLSFIITTPIGPCVTQPSQRNCFFQCMVIDTETPNRTMYKVRGLLEHSALNETFLSNPSPQGWDLYRGHGKTVKSQRRRMTQRQVHLPDTTGLTNTRTHRDCDHTQRTNTGSNQAKSQH